MKQKTLNARQTAFAERMAAGIIRRQTKVAGYLNRRTQHWNRTSKLIALALFILLFGGASLWFIIHAFLK